MSKKRKRKKVLTICGLKFLLQVLNWLAYDSSLHWFDWITIRSLTTVLFNFFPELTAPPIQLSSTPYSSLRQLYYQSKRYCPVLVAQEGSALWGITLATALLLDQNWTIPFGLIVQACRKAAPTESQTAKHVVRLPSHPANYFRCGALPRMNFSRRNTFYDPSTHVLFPGPSSWFALCTRHL